MKTNIILWTVLAIFVEVLSELETDELLARAATIHRKPRPTLKINDLWNSVRVHCVVVTGADGEYHTGHFHSIKYAADTWLRKCNTWESTWKQNDRYYRMKEFPLIGNQSAIQLLQTHFTDFIHSQEFEDVDWVLLTVDETFMVMENLRHLLLQHDPMVNYALGFRRSYINITKPVLDADFGVALSREAFRALVKTKVTKDCRKFEYPSMFSRGCYEDANVIILDSVDSYGKQLFRLIDRKLSVDSDISKTEGTEAGFLYRLKDAVINMSELLLGTWLWSFEGRLYQFLSHDLQIGKGGCDRDWKFSTGVVEKPLFSNEKNSGSRSKGFHSEGLRLNESVEFERENEAVPKEKVRPTHRIACLVNTTRNRHQIYGVNVKDTWGAKCSYLVFISDEEDKMLPAVNEGVVDNPWNKLKASLIHAYENYVNKVDWILLIEDSGYVFFSNIPALLNEYSPSQKIALGCYKMSLKQNRAYLGLNCGLILSKAAVKAFVEEALKIPHCKKDTPEDDSLELGHCLQSVGINLVDTKDISGKHRFLPYGLESVLMAELTDDEVLDSIYKDSYALEGQKCCSREIVMVGSVKPYYAVLYDYFEYKFKLLGVQTVKQK